jgi:hypothetical protein
VSDDGADKDDEDGASFAYVAGSGSLNLNGWSFLFGGSDLTPIEQREQFHLAIARLKDALDAYEPLASVFDLDDDRLVDAATEVHRALRDMQAEHARVTGGQFPHSRDELRAHSRGSVPEPEPDEDLVQVPPFEFPTVVPLGIDLSARVGLHRVRSAEAYSSGIVLTIESYLVRGDRDWPTWQQESNDFSSFIRTHDELIVAGHAAGGHGGSASGGVNVARREQQYWVLGPFDGTVLECEYRPTENERLAFTLDARDLREAQSRASPI